MPTFIGLLPGPEQHFISRQFLLLLVRRLLSILLGGAIAFLLRQLFGHVSYRLYSLSRLKHGARRFEMSAQVHRQVLALHGDRSRVRWAVASGVCRKFRCRSARSLGECGTFAD